MDLEDRSGGKKQISSASKRPGGGVGVSSVIRQEAHLGSPDGVRFVWAVARVCLDLWSISCRWQVCRRKRSAKRTQRRGDGSRTCEQLGDERHEALNKGKEPTRRAPESSRFHLNCLPSNDFHTSFLGHRSAENMRISPRTRKGKGARSSSLAEETRTCVEGARIDLPRRANLERVQRDAADLSLCTGFRG